LIVTILNDSFLEDLGSTNGTLVNGNPIKKHILHSNDVIEIGKYKLKFVSEAPTGQASVADFEKTMVLRPPAAKSAMEGMPAGFGDTQVNPTATTTQSRPQSVISGAAKQTEKIAAVQILSGPAAGKELELTKNLTTLGKPGVQVAVITRRPHGYFITHVEGAKYPIINGKTLDAQAHPLHDHDVVELAGVKMEFFLKNS
jgi:pSer/pThr/pTyr-binding forkhead associated (FHA) protein